MSTPWYVTVPARARIRPEMVLSSVDLPAPLEPMSATVSPACTRSEAPSTARMLP